MGIFLFLLAMTFLCVKFGIVLGLIFSSVLFFSFKKDANLVLLVLILAFFVYIGGLYGGILAAAFILFLVLSPSTSNYGRSSGDDDCHVKDWEYDNSPSSYDRDMDDMYGGDD